MEILEYINRFILSSIIICLLGIEIFLIGLLMINNNEDISNILLIILILGNINHFYDLIVEVIKIVISRFKEEFKKKNK